MTGVCNVTQSQGNEIFERIAIATNGDVYDFAAPSDEYLGSTTKIDVTTHKPTTEINNIVAKKQNHIDIERIAKTKEQIQKLMKVNPEKLKKFSKNTW